MKYLKLFETLEEYELFTNSDNFISPNISLCLENNELFFNGLSAKFKIVNDSLIAEGGAKINNYSLDLGSNKQIKINNYRLIL